MAHSIYIPFVLAKIMTYTIEMLFFNALMKLMIIVNNLNVSLFAIKKALSYDNNNDGVCLEEGVRCILLLLFKINVL